MWLYCTQHSGTDIVWAGLGRCHFLIAEGHQHLLLRTLSASEGGGLAVEHLPRRERAQVAERAARRGRGPGAPDAVRQGRDFLVLLKEFRAQVRVEFYDTSRLGEDGR